MLPRIEARAVGLGALVAIALAVPPAVIGRVLHDDGTLEGSAWAPLLFGWIVIAFVAGGYVAARRQPHAPMAHGAIAAFLAFAAVQGVGVARQWGDEDGVMVLSVVFNGLLAASTGMIGGLVANWRRIREHPT